MDIDKRAINDIFKHVDSSASELREELDEHLDAINRNTEEISIQNSAVCEIDHRLIKLEEKMDKLCFMFKQLLSNSLISVNLTKEEQRTFLMLYTTEGFQSADEINKKSDLDMSDIEDSLMSLMDKGVPVEREIIDQKLFFRLNEEFKQKQARDNIVKIDTEIKRQFQNTLLNQFFG
ncbi:hypothetical protein ACFL0V_05585 [Nanoarchaeota archaeon]